MNGDGYADVIIGDPAANNFTGQTSAYLGNGEGGRMVLVEAARGDGSGTNSQPWGHSNHPSQFEVSMMATHPQGRERIKLQVEVCPAGGSFGGQRCKLFNSPSWTDVTASPDGVNLTLAASGLDNQTLYHWRARILFAPFSVTQPGIKPPPNPAHGPWRRYSGQVEEADVRTSGESRLFLPLVKRD